MCWFSYCAKRRCASSACAKPTPERSNGMPQQFIKTKSGRLIALPNAQEDAAINAAVASDTDSPEWTEADFASAQPASDFFDPATRAKLSALQRKPGERGPQKAPTKVSTTIR